MLEKKIFSEIIIIAALISSLSGCAYQKAEINLAGVISDLKFLFLTSKKQLL